ncbi:MAG: hypothetical protein HY287_16135 [Planctomycetes bacterium]|nr:hypothetical protein [Planctomycetota bacterium]
MIARWLGKLAYASACLFFIIAFVIPAVFLVERCVAEASSSQYSFSISSRQLIILFRTIGLAACGALLACLLSVPAAISLGRVQIAAARPLTALLLIELLCPPIVYAFGWERLFPRGFSGNARCVIVWGLWTWPIPAVVLSAAFVRIGVAAYEAASLETNSFRAFLFVVLPALRVHITASFLVLFVLFLGDTAIPSACALIVFPTELMGQASSSIRLIDVAWPAVLVILPAWTIVLILWRFRDAATEGEVTDDSHHGRRSVIILMAAILIFIVGTILPLATLCANHASFAALRRTLMIYGSDIFWSLFAAMAAGIAVALGGLIFAAGGRLLNVAAQWALLVGAVPGALIGAALIAAYNRLLFGLIYDHWPIVTICYISKFGWIGGIAGYAVVSARKTGLLAQASLDGASESAQLWRVVAPLHSRMLVACVTIVSALSLGEAATSDLVRIPAFQTAASILIEKFHRFEDEIVVGITLIITGLVVVASIVLGFWPAHRGRRR